MNTHAQIIAAAGCLAACTLGAHAQVNAEPTKSGGDFISGTGIPNGNFASDSGDVSLYLRARARSNGQPLLVDGTTYIVLDGPAPMSSASWWSFDFQFTPRPGDTVGGANYNMTLEFDLDPSSATDFVTISQPMFDDDADPSNSWDDGDGLFVNPGPGAWSDDSIEYVYSQSWRPDFGFLNGSILPAGDYTVRLTAAPTAGNIGGSTVSTEITVRVVPAADAALSLDTQDACLDAGENQLVVDVNLTNAQASIVGGQFFLAYDQTKLDFISAVPGDAPFSAEVAEIVDEMSGEITYAVGIPAGTGTTSATTMARLTFETLGDFCADDALVSFRTGVLPTRVTDSNGTDIQPTLADLIPATKDSVAPTITAPGDIFAYADAGTCEAFINPIESFDSGLVTGPSQAPGVWYTDRYAPAAFESASFAGDDRLRIGISSADSAANRPGSFSSAFYDTQGRKFDVDIPVGQVMSGDLYIPASWATSARRSDMWGTMYDSFGNITGFPILGFICNDPGDPYNTTPANPQPRFRYYSQDADQDPSNGILAGWVEIGLPAGFSYNRWWTLEVELTDAAYIVRIIDDMGDTVYQLIDPLIFGSNRFGNIIMQAFNFGETYDAYWDNVTVGPAGPVAGDDCSDVALSFVRSDDPSLGLLDPFPAGQTTTVTWTATDACGNSSSDSYDVVVDGSSLLEVAVELQGVVDPGPFDRCITFEMIPAVGPAIEVSQTLTFSSGFAMATVEVPCGDYTCVTARDTLHTLRKTDNDDFGISGTSYVADFTSAGDDDRLPGGNLNDDTFIDILDFGLFIGQLGSMPGADTACGVVGPHADVTGDGTVGVGDFTFIQINFLEFSEQRCDGSILLADADNRHTAARPVPLTQPLTSVSVDDLVAMGMGELAAADLNSDARISEADMVAFVMGARPDHLADVDGSGRVDFFDIAALAGMLNQQAALPFDMNGDGLITVEDLLFVRDRMGMTFVR